MQLWIVLTVLAVILLLVAEGRQSQQGRWLAKPLASTGFLLMAHAAGAFTNVYGIIIFVALALSWVGDVFLIPKSKLAFLIGLFSFLLAHVAFSVAFILRGFHWLWGLTTLPVVAVIAVLVHRWLKPYVEAKMQMPVLAYMVVISLMVVTAFAAYPATQSILIPIAAVAFFLSDIAVARNRFISPGYINRLWGLPLYYSAQLMFAYTCQGGF